MKGWMMRRVGSALALAGTWAALAAGSASAAPATTHYTGTLPDGATWIADVPASWNGTLLLYSHGYGPLNAADAPNAPTQQTLLSMGYALAGSSYDPHGSWWALGSAVRDQFKTLKVVKQTVLPSAPRKVYAVGTSMGGLVSALEDQNSNGRLDAALTTCGIVAGANNLNQYQLDGEYALSELLARTQNIKLTNFTVGPPAFSDSANSAAQLLAAASAAQGTPQGRARLALAMAFLNVSPWGGSTIPNIYDYLGQEQGQYQDYFVGGASSAISFIVTARQQLEAAAGGEGSGTVGVDFARLLHRSSYYPEVKALYNEAGLSLKSDLATLARNANLKPDRTAYHWLARTSVPTGRLQVPELDLHTISDQLVPVQQENYYHALVARAGDSALLRQAFVEAQGHCNFTPAEIVAGVQAVASRVATGSWDSVTTATHLNAAAGALTTDLGGGAFLPFWPTKLTGAISPFQTEGRATR
ncbi:MAG: hypothetical protein JO372_05580 [Solirubrobacterales bacterium]|nr:hypothetical protein [Solirubrobacterales bacterium]